MAKTSVKAKAVGPKIQIVMRKVSELVPHPENPKTHPKAQMAKIVRSMEQFGWTIPVLIDENNQILAGHGRVAAAKQIGLEEAPCVIAAGFSDEQKLGYVVADNQLAEVSDMDKGKLAAELQALREQSYDLALTGFKPEAIQALLADNPAPNIGEVKAPTSLLTVALEWDGKMVPMEPDEIKMLDTALADYVHTKRTRAWFIDSVLSGEVL